MEIVELMEGEEYEQLVVATDRSVGLRAFVAIHDTTLGPALGGCRIWSYPTEKDALVDVLRLAKAMTYKNALAGLDLGGGKALIWTDANHSKTESLLKSFGGFIQTLAGRYCTTEDVGSTTQDMVTIRTTTDHVVGLPVELGGSGDPSKATGFGVFHGMRAATEYVLGIDSFAGVTIAFQGFGKVARCIVPYLLAEGARIVVADIDRRNLDYAENIGCIVHQDPTKIFDVECEIFAPCAMGGALNSDTIPRLRTKIVAGCANNQLENQQSGIDLRERGILYIPDFVINAGGVINLSFEMGRTYSESHAMERVAKIYDSVNSILALSDENGAPPVQAAESLAEERIRLARLAE